MSAIAKNDGHDATANNILTVLGKQGNFNSKSPHSNKATPGVRETAEDWLKAPILNRRVTTVHDTTGKKIVGDEIKFAWHPNFEMATHKFGDGIVHVVTYHGKNEQRMRLFFRRRTNQTNKKHDVIVSAMHDRNLVDRRLFIAASQLVVDGVIHKCSVLVELATPGRQTGANDLVKLTSEEKSVRDDTMSRVSNELHEAFPEVETIKWLWAAREFNKTAKTNKPESGKAAVALFKKIMEQTPPTHKLVKTATATSRLIEARKITMRATYAPQPDRSVLFSETIDNPTLTGKELPSPADVVGGLQMVMAGKATRKYAAVLHKLHDALVANGYNAGPLMIA